VQCGVTLSQPPCCSFTVVWGLAQQLWHQTLPGCHLCVAGSLLHIMSVWSCQALTSRNLQAGCQRLGFAMLARPHKAGARWSYLPVIGCSLLKKGKAAARFVVLLLCPVRLQVLHFSQLYQTGRCQLFDYGSSSANMAAYQQSSPPLVSDLDPTLRGVPVHLVSGLHDGVIPAGNVLLHYQALKAAGVDVSYRQVSGQMCLLSNDVAGL